MNPANASLETWLATATCGLADREAARVRSEITDHFEETLAAGSSREAALDALGNPRAANRQYRRVLLTASQARLLEGGQWETRAFCSRTWLRWLPLAAVTLAAVSWSAGWPLGARITAAAALGLAFVFTAPALPVYTPARARLFRIAKWVAWAAGYLIAAGPSLANAPWMFAVCAWPVAWIEIERAAIRRKLPVSAWPRHLYL